MNPMIQSYLMEIKQTRAESTTKAYEERLHRFSNYLRGRSEFTRAVAVSFLLSLQDKEFGPASVSLHQSTLKSFYGWLSMNGHIEKNLMETNAIPNYKSASRPETFVFTPAEYETVKKECMKIQDTSHLFWHDAVVCAYHTGLRMGDIAHLSKDQVDLHQMKITVTMQKTRRFAKKVEIPIMPELAAILQANTFDGWLFPEMAASYDRSGNKALSVFFGRLLKRCGIQGKSWHAFRHTASSRMLIAGVPIGIVSSITGQTIPVLQRYLHVPFDQKRSAFEKAFA